MLSVASVTWLMKPSKAQHKRNVYKGRESEYGETTLLEANQMTDCEAWAYKDRNIYVSLDISV